MSRQEFPRAVKVECIKRATRDGVIYCDGCRLPCRRFDIDHRDADGLTGKPTIENAQLLCEPCHLEKTGKDVSAIAEAKRREAAHLGAKSVPSRPLQSAGFPTVTKTPKRPQKQLPPRRGIYRDVTR